MLRRRSLAVALLALPACQPSVPPPAPVVKAPPVLPLAPPVAVPEPLPTAPAPRAVRPEPAREATPTPPAIPPVAVFDGVKHDIRRLKPVADDLFERERFSDALDAYTRWEPRSFCANCSFAMHDTRHLRIALCYSHLENHAAAAGACLKAAGEMTMGDTNTAVFTVQLYREAGQLDDLVPLLAAVEKRAIDEQEMRRGPLTPRQRAEHLAFTRAGVIRLHLRPDELGHLKPWPIGVPKPKPGSLPKSLPK